ncbi:hypothetical protein B0H11DRAFT_2231542 [Mycena galericulata]|nr:hypothetical protein B0H11DRAFT_2240767 [Mycena galericulata]KAJ7484876.1 hypothetical protein B0H11DRAFT_2231542 [Mycena galericulata]
MHAKTLGYSVLPTDESSMPDSSNLGKKPLSGYRLILCLSLLCNAALLLHCALIAQQQRLSFPEAGYSPAQHVIQYKTVKFNRGLRDDIPLFDSAPSIEGDEAWKDLYAYSIVKIPKSEVVKMNNETLSILGNERDYIIALDVFHQLHCLDMIRQQLEITGGANYTGLGMRHLRHCVGAIRQSLMCYADTTPVVWQWSAELMRVEQRDDLVHTCRDFDKIQSWTREHSVGRGERMPELTPHPVN